VPRQPVAVAAAPVQPAATTTNADVVLFNAQLIEQSVTLFSGLVDQLPVSALRDTARSTLEKCRLYVNDSQRRDSAQNARVMVEKLTDAVLQRHGVIVPARTDLVERINAIPRGAAPREVVQAMHRIRELGNIGAHGSSVSLDNVVEIVRCIGTVMPWAVTNLK
jgi:hypothetical protein